MLYLLLAPLADQFHALNLFRYITFRAGGGFFTSLLISLVFGTDAPCPNGVAPGKVPVAATIVQAERNEINACTG